MFVDIEDDSRVSDPEEIIDVPAWRLSLKEGGGPRKRENKGRDRKKKDLSIIDRYLSIS